MGKLTDKSIRHAEPKAKPYKMADGKGLYLLVRKNGRKYWRFDYRYFGKRKTLALGVYPDVTLKQARKKHGDAQRLIEKEIDPAQERKNQKIAKQVSLGNSFKVVADEWCQKKAKQWSVGHFRVIAGRLKKDILPYMGHRPVADISAPEILAVCRRVEARGAVSSAHRVRVIIGQVMRYAVACGIIPFDPTPGLQGALEEHTVKHFDSITDPGEIGELLNMLENTNCSEITRAALRLTPHVFLRPGELRQGEWKEFDLEARLWRIPAERMKGRRDHVIPLSRQAMSVIIDLRPLTGHRRYLFPSNRPGKPLSDGAIRGVLNRAGFGPGKMTAHSFRHMASTRLHDAGVPSHLIERQLAHKDQNIVRESYNAAEYIDDRTTMMQYWSDCIDAYCKGETPLSWEEYLGGGKNAAPFQSVGS